MSKLFTALIVPILFLIVTSCGSDQNSANTPENNSNIYSVSIKKSILYPGDVNCANGGIAVGTGIDTNGNGILDEAEITNTEYVCNGSAGQNGADALVDVTDEPVGDNCSAGGLRIDTGIDLNKNAILDSDEISNTSYVCNGNNGTGSPVSETLNVNGTILPGNYLSLQHNLNRNDLTFTGQYLQNNYIYDFSDYQQFYSSKTTQQFEDTSVSHISSTTLLNGNVFISYRDNGNSNYGTFVIYTPSGSLVVGPTVFENSAITYTNATVLQNGNVFITYVDTGNSNAGTFVVYSPAGTQVVAPTVFNSAIGSVSSTALQNGNVFIAYTDTANSNAGTFVIYGPTGLQVFGPSVFNSSQYTYYTKTITLANGNILVVFSNASQGIISIYNPSGSIVLNPTPMFSATSAAYKNYFSAAALPDGNFVITYVDGGNSNYGTFIIYSSSGQRLVGPVVFNNANTSQYHTVTALPDNKFMIFYCIILYDGSNYGVFSVYNRSGALIASPAIFCTLPYYYSMSYINSNLVYNGNVFISYNTSTGTTAGGFSILNNNHLSLQRVSSNEVRLWNYTEEPLEMFLSVNQ